jgi:hypothetical protein
MAAEKMAYKNAHPPQFAAPGSSNASLERPDARHIEFRHSDGLVLFAVFPGFLFLRFCFFTHGINPNTIWGIDVLTARMFEVGKDAGGGNNA